MKLMSIIGTRPQYIKICPVYHFLLNKCNHCLVDTNQHFDHHMSRIFLDEFKIHVDYDLGIENTNHLDFIAACLSRLNTLLDEVQPSLVIVIGDTNSTITGALAAKKKGLPVAHIESGIRSKQRNTPEEINRRITDQIADIHFISRHKDAQNISNPVYIGDLEYAMLNELEHDHVLPSSGSDEFVLMTIHRQENLNSEALNRIFKFCATIDMSVIFPIHPTTEMAICKNELKINTPDNIRFIHPLSYQQMIYHMNFCKFIISDSGGVIKITPFFGKKVIIPLHDIGWDEVVRSGYGHLGLDVPDGFMQEILPRRPDFYFREDSCKILFENIQEFLQ